MMLAVTPKPPIEVNLAPQELTFADARGGRRPATPLTLEVLRVLEPADLQALGGAVAASTQRLLQIRAPHHQLARLLCEGREHAEIALITGYTPSYISTIQNDPAFAELMNYYSVQREQVFIETAERMKALGLHTLEEIQRRLEEAPEKFSNREIMELAELVLVKPVAAASKGNQDRSGNALAPHVHVTFVGAQPQNVLDITPREDK